jgi:solute:Na+ symporter, SSS family
MDPVVVVALGIYAGSLVAVARRSRGDSALDYLLDGRRLTTPAFVATLVSTWYGGVLGVGEYSFRYGISNWLAMGVPYYLAALVFAYVLAERARRTEVLSIPDQLRAAYGPQAARLGAALVLLLAIPAAYVLMLGDLLNIYLGAALPVAVVLGTGFTIAYVVMGGFRSVVRTNVLQFCLMYGGFLVILPVAIHRVGGFSALWAALPATHRSWDGGMGAQFVLVWYFIAMQTLVEPTFYQRCYAADSPRTAKRAVLISIGFWVLFDFLTTFTGMAARVLIPDLADPVMAYPELGRALLPSAFNALFAVGLFATVMSTAHSYLFLGAATLGHDVVPELKQKVDERLWTMIGLGVVGAAAVALALALRSVIGIWHDVGSVVTAALLLPTVLAHFPARWRYSPAAAVAAMSSASAVCLLWLAVDYTGGRYPLGVEPIFPALAVSAACWLWSQVRSGVDPSAPVGAGGGAPKRAREPRPDPDRTVRLD